MVSNKINSVLNELRPKTKEPRSRSVLDSWISKIEAEIDPTRSGRLAWLVASTVTVAKLQSVLDDMGDSRFSLKGGTLLQHKLGLSSRATRDLDGIIRGDIDDFIACLDSELDKQWGAIEFSRTEVELINTPAKIIKPRRFTMSLSLRGQKWRNVVVEISPDEGKAGSSQEIIDAPNLSPFGLPTPDGLIGLAMSYQIAQKLHGATDPHDPPKYTNRRARDVVDLILIKELVQDQSRPSDEDIKAAIEDVFETRAKEAKALDRVVRTRPSRIIAYAHWESDFADTAQSCGVELSLEEAVHIANDWLGAICGFDQSNPEGFSAKTLTAMDDAESGRVIGPFKDNGEMWASIFDDEEQTCD